MSLVSRAMNMLKTPKTEWDVIAGESATAGSLFSGYAVPLSLLSSIAGFISAAFLATAVTGMLCVHISYGMSYWVGHTVLSWVLSLVGLYVAAVVVNMLAKNFASTPNQVNALKLVIYGYTAAWIGGIVAIIPVIGWLAAIAGAIYSIYLFYLGIPKMMGTPQDKVVVYMIVSAAIIVIISIVIGMIVGGISTAMFVASDAIHISG